MFAKTYLCVSLSLSKVKDLGYVFNANRLMGSLPKPLLTSEHRQ